MSTLHFAGSAPSLSFNIASRPGAGKPVRLHLTRRGWIVLVAVPLALLAAAALIVGSFFTSQAQATGVGGAVSDTVRVNVASGETLWALAAEYAPERDPRAVVQEIVELNALASSTVQAGQSLHIPVDAP
ncbi:LysM peptidoglycan-binding domain-containing protein [Arthrobacter sp. D2-10]